MHELAMLTQDAAELLFEMTAMGDSGDAVCEMLEKAEQLQVSSRPRVQGLGYIHTTYRLQSIVHGRV